MLGFENFGQKMLDILSLRYEPDKIETDPKQKEAYALVWRLLTKSSVQKITGGKGLTHSKNLGALLDDPVNAGKDCGEGTWAEMLRYGSVHFELH